MATNRRSRRKSISGNITDVQKRVRYLETRPSAGRLASKAVSTKNLALRAVEEDIIADNAIVRRSIAASAVGTGQIEVNAITNDLIAANAVNTNSIASNAVTSDEIATGAVGNTELGTNSVTNDKIASNAVNSDSIATGAVGNTELGTNSVTNDKIASNAVNSDSIATGAVGTNEIASLAVTTDKIASLAVTTDKIADSAVTDAKIDGIAGSKIIGGIDGALINTRTITSNKIAIGAITDTEIAPNAVGYAELKTKSIFNDNINLGVVVGSSGVGDINIQNYSIGSGDIFSSAITSAKIDNLAVLNRHINDVSGGKITGNGTIAPAIVSGLTSAFTTCAVSGTGISRTLSANGDYRRFDITIAAGTGSNELAIGNHTHAASAVGAHTHNATLSLSSLSISGGAHGHTAATGAHTHGITPTGSVSVGSVITSTIKLKQDVTDYSVADVKNILNLKMKKYKYKNSVRGIQNRYNREWMYGYIAEEVQDLGVEQILAYDKNGDPDGIDYGLLSVLILELVKVQQTEIDSLSEEIKRLKDKI